MTNEFNAVAWPFNSKINNISPLFTRDYLYLNFRKHVTQTVFKRNDEFPFGRVLPLHKTEAFNISAFYEFSPDLPQTNTEIGTWQVQDVTKPVDADYRIVRVKLQVDHNGIFSVRKAVYEELAPPEPENDEEPVN